MLVHLESNGGRKDSMKVPDGYQLLPKKYKLKKRFYFKEGGYVEKGTLVEWTEEHGGCYWWDLDHFGKDFVENNREFFDPVTS